MVRTLWSAHYGPHIIASSKEQVIVTVLLDLVGIPEYDIFSERLVIAATGLYRNAWSVFQQYDLL
jgi:hypothetical protein